PRRLPLPAGRRRLHLRQRRRRAPLPRSFPAGLIAGSARTFAARDAEGAWGVRCFACRVVAFAACTNAFAVSSECAHPSGAALAGKARALAVHWNAFAGRGESASRRGGGGVRRGVPRLTTAKSRCWSCGRP